MRLGDLDALKEAFKIEELYWGKRIIDIIDNAPTVEAFTKDDMAGAYNEGYACGGRESKRPQGEWIMDGHHIRCNKCNEYICNTDREGNKIPDNFCPNCGADMRGAE